MKCSKIWDITNAVANTDNRSAATNSIQRQPTNIKYTKIPFLNSSYDAMCFVNRNGSNIYIYPGFAALFDDKNNFGLIELDELYLNYSISNFIEEEKMPKDTKIVGQTWEESK